MKIGIVGCGLIGQKRAKALRLNHQLVAVADVVEQRAQQLASGYPGCVYFSDWRQVVDHPEVELVIVATTNNMLTPVALAVVKANKHLLLEKPGARNATELAELVEAAEESQSKVKVGFNHRFHPAFLKAREIWETGEPGELMFIRGRYGHGGRLGYEKEWRADPEIAGGGELLDQGVHLIDLSRWYAGEFDSVEGHVATYFWQMPVEDSGFMLLKSTDGAASNKGQPRVAWLHVSCTEWKNLFSFEIFGRYGKLQIDGLGGSYGVERLTYYRMLPEMGPPETTTWEYPGEDKSWILEFNYFVECIEQNRNPEGNLHDALASLKVVEKLYKLSSVDGATLPQSTSQPKD
ncbi:MAG: Gfo/Idh/MocA family oxidoreductase [Chloroflexota bacterium]|nr:Gfo/Idh/MocA family oxidoreductase [Chloroflexota bacterium]